MLAWARITGDPERTARYKGARGRGGFVRSYRAEVTELIAAVAWVIRGLRPFSRLVHAWSYPVRYVWRPYHVFRSRVPAPPAEPGPGGRRWRKIGVPY